MPRTRQPAADPTEIFPFPVGETPPDDRAYFEMLTWFVFGAGLNWRVMRAKWPAFQKAFRKFNINTVARFGDDDVDRLIADAAIVRNGKKIVGTIANARELQAIAKEHGGMTPWIRGYRSDVATLIRDTKKRFHHIGDTTSRLFLSCAGALEYPTWDPTPRQLVAGSPQQSPTGTGPAAK
jgi:DNA-3-methyladenine glycosylase I